jgi:hypothetical protein
MTSATTKRFEDRDSVHILPLSIVPLKTRALRDARLVKNSQLQGVVELYSGADSGSGQIFPEELTQFFDFSGPREDDIGLISRLSLIPSYDVYSLRIELRDSGIPIENNSELKLSDGKARELTKFMNVFTGPLVAKVYGSDSGENRSLDDLIGMFLQPDVGTARRNLQDLARSLGIDLLEIPQFLERYGDIYLSLAYYASVLEEVSTPLESFASRLATIREDSRFRKSRALLKNCEEIEDRLLNAKVHISNVLGIFEDRTRDMWRNVSGVEYRQTEQLILDFHKEIGATLCALYVKMQAWRELPGKGSINNCVQFIMSEMMPGLDGIPAFDSRFERPAGRDEDVLLIA